MKPIDSMVAVLVVAAIELPSPASARDARLECAAPTRSPDQEIRQRPEAELKQLFLRCALASERRRLASEEIAACSVAHDTLLKNTFRNDFDAMLAWSRRRLASERALVGSPD